LLVGWVDQQADGARVRLSTAKNVVIAPAAERGEGEGLSVIDIRVGRDILERLRWSVGQPMTILEGVDVDAGHMKVVPAQAGRSGRLLAAYTDAAHRLRWPARLFRHHVIGPHASSCVVRAEAFGGELLVWLPAWFEPKAHPAPPSAEANAPAPASLL
jgi:hypothetical protein